MKTEERIYKHDQLIEILENHYKKNNCDLEVCFERLIRPEELDLGHFDLPPDYSVKYIVKEHGKPYSRFISKKEAFDAMSTTFFLAKTVK